MPPHNTAYEGSGQDENLARVMGPLLSLTIVFFLLFVARQVVGPLLPAMERDLGLSHAQGGLFLLCMGCGFFCSQLGAPLLTARWGYRRCILLSLWGAAGALVGIGTVHSAVWLCLGFLGLGITGGLYVPAGIALITVLVQPRDWGKAMGIHELAPNLALVTVPFLATFAVARGTWRLGFLGLAAALAVYGLVHALVGVDAAQRPSPPDLSRLRQVVASPSFWRLGLLLSLAVGVESGVYAMIPLFLVHERAFDLAAANQLLGFSRIPGIAMVLLAGWITDRLSPSTTVSIALGLTGIGVIALGVGPGWIIPPAVYLQAAASACLFPPILSMGSGSSSTQNRALMISLILAIAPVLGGGLVPAGIALAGDLGSFGLGLAAAGVLTVAGIWLVRRS